MAGHPPPTHRARQELLRKILFPDPSQPGPNASLPLESYTGTYFHPGYRNISIQSVGSASLRRHRAQLSSMREDFTWAEAGEFEHVSGEYWIMYTSYIHVPVDSQSGFSPVEFKLGADGKVVAVEIDVGGHDTRRGEGVILFCFEKIN